MLQERGQGHGDLVGGKAVATCAERKKERKIMTRLRLICAWSFKAASYSDKDIPSGHVGSVRPGLCTSHVHPNVRCPCSPRPQQKLKRIRNAHAYLQVRPGGCGQPQPDQHP